MTDSTRSGTSRRQFLRTFGTSVLFAALPGGAQARRKPNVLFIAVDDLRPQLGCYGHAETISPHIDQLARGGTLFERAYCNVPVCGPSRVSALTGVRAHSGQWRCTNLKTPYLTLPALFRQHGYHTVSNGKVLHHMQDRQEDWSEPPWRSVAIYHGKGDWAGYNAYGLWQDGESGKEINPKSKRGPYCEAADVPDNAYQDGKVADRTIADLKRLKDRDTPFFLACGFWRPHLPFNAPKRYWDLYRREDIALADNRSRPDGAPKGCRGSGEINQYARTGKHKATDAFHREARHAYYACVSYVDAQIGRVLKAVDELELADDTIVVLWGDHGWNLGEHGFWGKHNTLHNSLHSPLILRVPGRGKGIRTPALVEFVDIYPTLCELAGIPAPEHVQGTSMTPLLGTPQRPWKDAVFARWSRCQSVKTDRYLYTQWKNGDRMLFDHQTDPDENRNIAADPASAPVVARHQKLLAAGWQPVAKALQSQRPR